MSIPFGAMPADRQLATLGCGVAAIILGATTPRVAALVSGRTLFVSVSPMPWWFSALFAALALAVAAVFTVTMNSAFAASAHSRNRLSGSCRMTLSSVSG